MKKTLVLVIVAGMLLVVADSGNGSIYYVPTSTKTVDGDTFCGGSACTSADTIIIEGGARGNLRFQDFNGSGSYITITNENTNPASKVVITNDGTVGFGVLSLTNCKYVDFRGDNDGDLAYGIHVINDDTPAPRSGAIRVYGESDHIKLSYLEIDCTNNSTTSGIGIQTGDKSLTNAWTFDTFEIHHNYIHDTRYSGMYLGHNDPGVNNDPYVGTFSIHDNILENMGSYGMTFKGVKAANNYIYNNIVRNTGLVCVHLTGSSKHGIGVQMFEPGYMADIYNNRIEYTMGPGIKIGGGVGNLVHHNEILGCGTCDEVGWGHGIELHRSVTTNTEMYDNIILQSTRYGIYGRYETSGNIHKRNLIGDSGIGEWGGIGLTEGTCADVNIYHADVADFGFKVWSDDGDYSNDDFSLRDTLLLQIPQIGWTLVCVDSEETEGEDGRAINSFDGDPDTIWHTEWSLTDPDPCHPHEIQIDLGGFYDICGFRQLPRQGEYPNGMIKDYEFYVSGDSDNWGTAVASGTFANDQTEKQVSFDRKLGRRVRLVAISEVNDNPWTTMAELNVLAIQPDTDINNDGKVNIEDFAILAVWWENENACSSPGWCEGADFDMSGTVDMSDLAYFAENWLRHGK